MLRYTTMYNLKATYDKGDEHLQNFTNAYFVYGDNTRLHPNPPQMTKTSKQLVNGNSINKTKTCVSILIAQCVNNQ